MVGILLGVTWDCHGHAGAAPARHSAVHSHSRAQGGAQPVDQRVTLQMSHRVFE